jgi:hypothetical protein
MVKDFVIEEEYPDISTGVIDIAQAFFFFLTLSKA